MAEATNRPTVTEKAPVPGRIEARDLKAGVVLVSSSSNVNSIVISRLVSRAGFKALTASPEDAWTRFTEARPALVILDGGHDNEECAAFLGEWRVHEQPRSARAGLIFLSTRPLDEDQAAALGAPDAVVAKPITDEILQPAIRALSARQARDPSA